VLQQEIQLPCAGHDLGTVNFDGSNGGWTLGDDFYSGGLLLNQGTLVSNNYNLNCGTFSTDDSTTVLLGTSVITASHVNLCSISLDADSADFIFPAGFSGFLYQH
jgi:hypothetical protein